MGAPHWRSRHSADAGRSRAGQLSMGMDCLRACLGGASNLVVGVIVKLERYKKEFDDVLCDGETLKAIHVIGDDINTWIPKSVVDDDSEVYKNGHRGTLIVPEWWAIEQGLV